MRQRDWAGHDAGLGARMFLVMFLLAALYLAFVAVLLYVGVDYLLIALLGVVMLGAQYFLSDKLVLWSMGAREVSPEEAPELHAMIDRLVQLGDLPKPRVAIADTPVPNAFATGRSPKNSVVCVTTGILQRLDASQLEAVLAHELTHVKNRDVMVITLASFFASIASMLMHWLPWLGYGGSDDRRDRGAGGVILIYLASIAVWIISFFLIRALSRYREYAADRGGAILIGSPSRLASALAAISDTMQRIPNRDLRQVEGANAFFIVPAFSGQSFMELLSTHPSTEKRIERLMAMEQRMEGRTEGW